MAFFKKSKTKRKSKDQQPVRWKELGRASESKTSHFFETSRLIEISLFFVFSALVIIICFLGQKPKGPRLILNQPAPTRIVAEFPFEYESTVKAEAAAAAARAQVPPVFQRTFEPFDNFRYFINDLNSSIAKNQIEYEDEGVEMLETGLKQTAQALIDAKKLPLTVDDITDLTSRTSPKERSALFKEALTVLRSIYEDGVYSSTAAKGGGPEITVIQLVDEAGRQSLPNARSLRDAEVELRVRINELSTNRSTARALFNVFSVGITPNLIYSDVATNRAIERAIQQLPSSTVQFSEGDTLIEPGAVVTALSVERIAAYRQNEIDRGNDALFFNKLFLERFILTLLLLAATYMYVRQGLQELRKRNRAIAITAVSILLNLLIIRAIMEIGETALINNRPTLSMLPYVAPYALAPIIIAVLVGGAPALLSALLIAVLFGIIQGNSIEFVLIAFVSGVAASFVSTNIRKRSRLVRSGLYAGATAAIAGAAVGLLNGFSFGVIGQQTIIALIVGLLTGIIAIGLLPVFEQIFKISTEITLLELTDFNHPLLRRMQLEAPGTYHHSLMVANLSENAAASIGANPLLCRVCCLFHDIGKLVKPDYFTENQRSGINPHNEKNPSMSALVIKAHVKEGVELARAHKLPKVIIDVIRQHHGTGLIQYFYYQAQQQVQKKNETEPPFSGKNGKQKVKEELKVDESTYRYDGPKPEFKESAIIFFADSVEAASRTLKKVTQPNVEELIDKIFKARIEDGQLDNCPLTFHELDLIRSSFTYTLLNMLHARIEYPKTEAELAKDAAKKITANESTKDTDALSPTGDKQPV